MFLPYVIIGVNTCSLNMISLVKCGRLGVPNCGGREIGGGNICGRLGVSICGRWEIGISVSPPQVTINGVKKIPRVK